jgi:phage FluMu protein gp41
MNTMDEMNETEIITLHKPVKVGEMTYDTLTLREPTAGQLEKASQATTQIGVAISLIALVAKVPRAVIERLCQRDLKTISDFLGRFSDDAPETSAMSLPN